MDLTSVAPTKSELNSQIVKKKVQHNKTSGLYCKEQLFVISVTM